MVDGKEEQNMQGQNQQAGMVTQQTLQQVQQQAALQVMQQANAVQQAQQQAQQAQQAAQVQQQQQAQLQQAQQQQAQQQQQGQVMDAAQVMQSVVSSSPQSQTPQTLLVNTANLQQIQNVGTQGSPLCSMAQMQQQANNTTMQSQLAMPMSAAQQNTLGNMSLQQGVASGSTTITTMSTLQQPVPPNTPAPQLQQVTDWNTGRVQVIQQPMQNAAYVQQVYNAQGQMLMSGNIALHPSNMNPGSIQVITKPFQSNQLTSHVPGKSVLTTGGQIASFPSYATGGTSNPTLVIGQLVSSQPSILPAHSAAQTKQDLQKYATTCNNRTVGSNNVALSPWQFGTQIPQVWTAPHHPQVIAQNQIFIRGPHQEQPMFIQSPPQNIQQQQQQPQQNVTVPKQEVKTTATQQVSRTLSILPSVSTPIRPAGTPVQAQILQKQQNKLRTKAILTKNGIQIQKLDAQNQTKPQAISPQQHPSPNKQIVSRMIITSQGAFSLPTPQIVTVTAHADKVQQVQPQPGVQAQAQIAAGTGSQLVQSIQQTITATAVPQVQVQAVPQVQTVQAAQVQGVPQQQQVVGQPQMIQPKPSPLMNGIAMNPNGTLPHIPIVMQSAPIVTQQPITIKDGIPIQQPIVDQPKDESSQGDTQVQGSQQQQLEGNANEKMDTSETGNNVPGGGASEKMDANETGAVPEENKDKGPPKAMVKPQVLTHVIEGYVIQESSEPFPINRSSLLTELAQSVKSDKEQKPAVMLDADEPPLKKQTMDTSSVLKNEKAKCEHCGKVDLRDKFKKSKRFCSVSCSKRYNLTANKKGAKQGNEEIKINDKMDTKSDWKVTESTEGEATPIDTVPNEENNSIASESSDLKMEIPEDLPNPVKWTVAEVCDFIKKLPGCCDYVDDFAHQEIDGQALMLLKEDHLMSAMQMKLGPALKICAKIDSMRAAHLAATGASTGATGATTPSTPTGQGQDK